MRKSLPVRLRALAAEKATFGGDAELFAAAADRIESLEMLESVARIKAEDARYNALKEAADLAELTIYEVTPYDEEQGDEMWVARNAADGRAKYIADAIRALKE